MPAESRGGYAFGIDSHPETRDQISITSILQQIASLKKRFIEVQREKF